MFVSEDQKEREKQGSHTTVDPRQVCMDVSQVAGPRDLDGHGGWIKLTSIPL